MTDFELKSNRHELSTIFSMDNIMKRGKKEWLYPMEIANKSIKAFLRGQFSSEIYVF